jgi:small subunit ribosomal protein S2
MTETKKTVKKTVKKTTKKTTAKAEEKDDKKSKLSKLEELKEKAAALAAGVEENKLDVEAVKKSKKTDSDTVELKENALAPIEDYLKSSIHLGTRVITPDMKPYVYKRRADGLAVFNTALLDDLISKGSDFLAKFAPEDIIIVCKREAGWSAVSLFSELLGIKSYTKKYPAGVLTNPNLDDFVEAELVFILDPWIDKNALQDANRIGVPVLAVCDTNNYTKGLDCFIPGNNKSAKSIGMILYLLAKLYVDSRGLKVEVPPISNWVENWENLVPPK